MKKQASCRFAAEVVESTGETRKRMGSGWSFIRFLPLPRVKPTKHTHPVAAALDYLQRGADFSCKSRSFDSAQDFACGLPRRLRLAPTAGRGLWHASAERLKLSKIVTNSAKAEL